MNKTKSWKITRTRLIHSKNVYKSVQIYYWNNKNYKVIKMMKMEINQVNTILKFTKIKCKDHQVTLNLIMVDFNYLKTKTKIDIQIICYTNQ
jgi:hypothetical protein